MSGKTLIVLVGPTGVGKTDISLSMAERLGCPIVSSDSRQVYRELHIGTASPTEEQLRRVRHYMIASRSIHEAYSAGQYELDALELLDNIFSNNQFAMLVGGSMLYVDALCRGIDDLPSIDPDLRAEMQQFYRDEGIEGVRRKLRLVDEAHYHEVDLMNVKRMLHAIEVTLTAGRPFSELRTKSTKQRPFRMLRIGLERPREELYERINRRVEQMMAEGLEAEALSLLPQRGLNALDTVGYKELFAYFDGNCSLEQAVAKIQQNTRHYAKKQMTWFKRDKDCAWFHPDDEAGIFDYLERSLDLA